MSFVRIEALEEALARFKALEFFNTDQGCQFTSAAFTDMLNNAGIRISMDGRGHWLDNVFIERLWRSRKCEEVYLHAYECQYLSATRSRSARYYTAAGW